MEAAEIRSTGINRLIAGHRTWSAKMPDAPAQPVVDVHQTRVASEWICDKPHEVAAE